MFGYLQEELLGQKPYQIFLPEYLEIFRSKVYLETIFAKKDFTMQCPLRHKDGHYFWTNIFIRPIVIDGEVCQWQSVVRDINDLREREMALEQSIEDAREANKKLRENVNHLSKLNEISQALNEKLDL